MRQHQTITHLLVRIFAVISLTLLAAQFISAQVNTSAPHGFSPGKSYAISDIETIGLNNGNLMLNVPLGSLPAGRGGISSGVSLRYDSKIWDMFDFDVERFGQSWQGQALGNSLEGGWRYSYKYGLKLDHRLLGAMEADCTSGNVNSLYPHKLQLVTPDGSKHELSLGNGAASNTDADGYMSIFPDGRTRCSANSYPPSVTGTIVYFTTDGTFLRLEMESDSDEIWENNTWILYSPDGTRIIYNQRDSQGNVIAAQRTIDRNENFIDIIENASDSNYSGHRTTYLKDQLDRKVVIEYNAATDEDWVRSDGVAGEDIITKVKWKNITVDKTYYACFMAPTGPQDANRNYPLNGGLRVADKIYLPKQVGDPYTYDLYYTFGYNVDTTTATDVGWGEVSQVMLPSGAYATYSYSLDNISGWNSSTQTGVHAEDLLENRPVQKELHYNQEYDGSSTAVTETTTYTKVGDVITVTSPDGGTTIESYAGADSSFTAPATPEYVKGELLKSESADGTKIERVYRTNVPGAANNAYKANRYVKYEFVSPKDASGNYPKTAIKEYSHDKNGNVTEVKEYDYVTYSTVPRNSANLPNGLPSGATPARITKTEYYNDTPDAASTTYTDAQSYYLSSSPRIRNAVKSIEIQTGSGTPKSRTEMIYDNASTTGNPTETKIWDSYKSNSTQAYSNPLTSTNSISTNIIYNTYGSPTLITDAKGNQTQITYSNISTPSGNVMGLYPTQTITAYGTSIQRTSTTEYDFYTGLTTLTTDVDNSLSTATYYDDLGRPTKVATAVGTALEIWTLTEYDDVTRRVILKSDLETKGDGKKIAIQHFDQLGRVRLSRTIEKFATEDPTDETDGIKVQTRYLTSGSYNYELSSNPYRAAHSYDATNEPSMGWARKKTINTSKHSEIETFSGAPLPSPFVSSNANTNSTGIITTDIDSDRTLVTDQAGKQRISKTNGLNQITDIWEITASDSATVSMSFPNQTGITHGYQTSYSYDILNNLTTVSQGSQARTFTYNSLSRLISATNPESGTTSYQYDNNGNLTQKMDSRTVTTTNTYDALNRVTFKDYSDSTPDITYNYDNLTSAKGKLTKVITGTISSPFSVTEYTEFDGLGRIKKSKQTTDGTVYNEMTYTYNLSSALIEQTYPSGRKVKNMLDNDGKLSMVQSKKNSNYGYWNYADNFTYTASGATSSMQLGNGHWESTQFNSRLQPTQIALGTTQSATNVLKLDYSYGTTANNGNVQSQIITVPTVGSATGFTATQTYTYDSLNRIKDATETISNAQIWKQTFTYDRYGNRNFDEANTTATATFLKNCNNYTTVCTADVPVINPTVSTSNNRLNGYTFDNAGNITKDAQSKKFTYDAENKQIKVETVDSNNNVTGILGQYFYDGNGKRVKKISATETTIFVYNALGQLVAEYSTQIEPTSTAKVSYLTNDNLGTPRINTDANGVVTARHDYQPFGEETLTTQRTQGNGYSGDFVRQKFTGYERDTETDLDFAQARMYSKNLGRFTTVDPIMISDAHKTNPQRWNMYVYATNCPTHLIDPDGKKPKTIDVFILISEKELKDNGSNRKWDDLKKLAKEKGIVLNIYTVDDRSATLLKFVSSLNSKDRTIVIFGHSSTTEEDQEKVKKGGKLVGSGIGFSDGDFVDNTSSPDDGSRATFIQKVKASGLLIFTCANGNVNSELSSRMTGEFVSNDGGDDGETGVKAQENAAYVATETLINGGEMKKASEAAQKEINAQSGVTCSTGRKCNDGDKILYQDLRNRKSK